ncbi:hypothetical protein H696_03842 [Fonticula alba]|uniref:PITH domain-containing protein n=1 Tax=Fonticula alba TaxID=691883 RepID=A0A058Z5M2_FONAL|nr:hypothetical protein H696_03842 [Fonticula alba]KCV69411.1 hypothetical protein H696_03842 [Fonticula alba]|eukprot:XP_009495976.1 hypothetical protein H696_03842 [Fonticula alba]
MASPLGILSQSQGTLLSRPLRFSSYSEGQTSTQASQSVLDRASTACWQSLPEKTHLIQASFATPVRLTHVQLTFQGGFSCSRIRLFFAVPTDTGGLRLVHALVYPADRSTPQTLPLVYGHLPEAEAGPLPADLARLDLTAASGAPACVGVTLQLDRPADFYGRTILYHMDFLGERA